MKKIIRMTFTILLLNTISLAYCYDLSPKEVSQEYGEKIESIQVNEEIIVDVYANDYTKDNRLYCSNRLFVYNSKLKAYTKIENYKKKLSILLTSNSSQRCSKKTKTDSHQLATFDDYIKVQQGGPTRIPASTHSTHRYCYYDKSGVRGACFKSLDVCMNASYKRDRQCGLTIN